MNFEIREGKALDQPQIETADAVIMEEDGNETDAHGPALQARHPVVNVRRPIKKPRTGPLVDAGDLFLDTPVIEAVVGREKIRPSHLGQGVG